MMISHVSVIDHDTCWYSVGYKQKKKTGKWFFANPAYGVRE